MMNSCKIPNCRYFIELLDRLPLIKKTMKKNYKLLLIALVATIGMISCGKDDNPEKESATEIATGLEVIVGGKTYLISKVTYGDTDYGQAEYDSKGRLTKFSYFEDNELSEYYSAVYSDNQVTVTGFEDGVEESKIVGTFGANGYVSQALETSTYSDGGFNYNYKATDKFTYNNDGYVTKSARTEIETSNNPNSPSSTETSTIEFSYSNGNLVKTVEKEGEDTYTNVYEYFTDKAYSPAKDLDEFGFLFGKTSKNLVKKRTETHVNNGQSNEHVTNYTYTFNTDGLPSSVNNGYETQNISYVVK